VNEQSLAAGLNLAEVQELVIENRGGKIRIQRQGEGWQILEPFVAPADSERVETVIFNISGARRNNEIDAINIATYGLSEPVASVEIRSSGLSEPFRLILGNDSTYTGQAFAMHPNGRRLFTVGAHVKNNLLLTAQDFRRTRLLDIDTGDLASYRTISIGGLVEPVEIQAEGNRWNIIAPMEAVAERVVVEEYLRSVGLLRASGFLSEQGDSASSATEALAALTSPSLTLTLQRSQNRTQTLHLAQIPGGRDRVWVGRRPGDPEIFLVRPETINTLRRDVGFFRSRQLFAMKPEEVQQMSVTVGFARTDLTRDDQGRWVFLDRPDCAVDQDAVNIRLDMLLRSRILQFVDLNPSDVTNFGIPRMTFTLTSRDGQQSERIETGDSERGGGLTTVYARKIGDPAVFTMEVTKDLIILAETIAQRNFARFDYSRLSKLQLELGSEIHEIRLIQGSWKLRRHGETAETIADKPRVDRFVTMMDALESLRDFACTGERMIQPPAEAHFAIRALAADDTELMSMIQGRASGDRVFLTVNGRVIEARNPEIERLLAMALSIVQ
jgi:hypothetical protein